MIIGMMATEAAASEWSTSVKKDEMTVEVKAFANSSSTESTEPMSFPYTGTEAWLGVGCDSNDEWVYVGFSNAPNLYGTGTFDTRIKWDDHIEQITLWHDPGDRFLHVFGPDADAIISNIAQYHVVLLELDGWYGQGKVYFKFSLQGSSAALSKIWAACGHNPGSA